MSTRRDAVWLIAGCVAIVNTNIVVSQPYPNKTIRIVTAIPGSGIDLVARMVAQGISGPLGQSIIIENRPSGVVQGETVVRSPPDGYTLLMAASSHWVAPFFYSDATFDPVKDFAPITLVGSTPNLLVVHPSLAVASVKELIALAKAKPGQLNYGATQMGSPNHIAAELFNAMAGVKIVRVGYKGMGPALNALMAGEVHLAFGNTASSTAMVKSGKLRALAVTSAQPSTLAPALPTVFSFGVPGYEAASVYVLMALAKTPATIIRRLNQEAVRYVQTNESREWFYNAGIEAVGSSPEQLAAFIKADTVRLGKLIKEMGMRGE